MSSLELKATRQEIRENVNSIKAVPTTLLPDGPARNALLRRAQAGEDIYAYQPVGDSNWWNIWLVNERMTAQEYAATFTASR